MGEIFCIKCCEFQNNNLESLSISAETQKNPQKGTTSPRSANYIGILKKIETDDDNSKYSKSNLQIKKKSSCGDMHKKPSIINVEIKIQPQLFVNQNTSSPADLYERIALIGEGGYSKVMKVRHKKSKDYRAMKIIKKKTILEDVNEDSIFDEIKILKTLDHPNIIKIFEFFQDIKNYYLITELCEFGDLFENLIEPNDDINPYFTESLCCSIMKQLLSTIVYLHDQSIIHGDLKLENILVENMHFGKLRKNLNSIEIKIIDFGCSMFYKKNYKSNHSIKGTLNYIAPEALQGTLHKKNDIWSCGVVMYILLSGYLPFAGKTDLETIEAIEKGEFNFDSKVFENISNDAKDLIRLMLTLDYKKRIDARTAIKHNWFKIKLDGKTKEVYKTYQKEILNNLRNYQTDHKFQQAVLTYITHNLIAKEEIEDLRHVFKQLDIGGSGRITKEELQSGFLDTVGTVVGEMEMQVLMKNIDQDNNGYMEYEEFLQAALGAKNLLTNENLIHAFNKFDVDQSGDITTNEIRQIIGGEQGIDDDSFKELLNEINLENGESITFDRFKSLMKRIKKRYKTSQI